LKVRQKASGALADRPPPAAALFLEHPAVRIGAPGDRTFAANPAYSS
jgi:hypothetical protein